MSVRLADSAGRNMADAVIEGVKNGSRDIREFIQTVRNNPQALIANNTSSTVGWRDFILIEIAVAVGWWYVVVDEDESWSYLDPIGIVYISAVIFGVLR